MKDYNHFDQAPRGPPGSKSSKCPLYDNVEERHEREIKVAEAAARAEVIGDNPEVSEKDLEIKVSDAVKKATDERVKRAGAVPGGIPPGYGGLAGLLPPPGRGRRIRDRANIMEADMLDAFAADEEEEEEAAEALREQLAQLRRRRFALGAPEFALRQREGLPHDNRAAGAGDVIPPVNRRAVGLPIFGGFNEDPFGGGDDGDPMALHRLLYAGPARFAPGLAPAPAERANQAQAQQNLMELRLHQRRRQLLLQQGRPQPAQAAQAPPRNEQREAEQLERLEEAQLRARQRFDDRRGGQGNVFRRDAGDPRRQHGPGGWPGQN